MSNLKQLRSRVKTIQSTQKITKAMQLVSAAKLARVKDQISNSASYIKIVSNMMANIVSESNVQDLFPKEQNVFSQELWDRAHLLIVITSECGLCGAFNASIIKQVKADIIDLENNKNEIKLIIIGKKGYDALKGQYIHYIDSYFNYLKSDDNNLLSQINQKIMQMIKNFEVGSCQLYFNKFKNAMTQILMKQQILPIEQQIEIKQQNDKHYEYEGKGLISNIIDLYIKGRINYALLQSRASEEGARMTAMDNATRNANEIINKLTLKLNRSRQAIITKELIEIIAGAEAV